MSPYMVEAVQILAFNLDQYLHEETQARTDPFVDLNSTLCNIFRTDFHGLSEVPDSHYYDFARGMMTVFVPATANREGTTFTTAVRTVGSTMFLKDLFLRSC